MRSRILVAAEELTVADGWGSVTMSRLADLVGVSRQTIYNEVGSKPELAEAMVLQQLSTFLAVVEEAFDRYPTDAIAAVREAAKSVLRLAETNALLRAVVSSSQGGDSDLLPFLTTRSESLLDAAKAVLSARLVPSMQQLSRSDRAATVDMIVRTVLSHVMQPSGSPQSTAAGIARILDRVLGPRVALR